MNLAVRLASCAQEKSCLESHLGMLRHQMEEPRQLPLEREVHPRESGSEQDKLEKQTSPEHPHLMHLVERQRRGTSRKPNLDEAEPEMESSKGYPNPQGWPRAQDRHGGLEPSCSKGTGCIHQQLVPVTNIPLPPLAPGLDLSWCLTATEFQGRITSRTSIWCVYFLFYFIFLY